MRNIVLPRLCHGKTMDYGSTEVLTEVLTQDLAENHKRTVVPQGNKNVDFGMRMSYLKMLSDRLYQYSDSIQQRIFKEKCSGRECVRIKEYNTCNDKNYGLDKNHLNEKKFLSSNSDNENCFVKNNPSKESVIYRDENKRTKQSHEHYAIPNNLSDKKCSKNITFMCNMPKSWNFVFSGYILFLLALLTSTCFASENVQDLRCFNVAGGPVENFFVKESLPVGSVIGSLGVEGDPGPAGDIFLRLESHDVPVQITAGTKDLVLNSALDKEGVNGVNYVTINVSCKRRGTTEPSINIPVNIRVTDVNDNAPIFLNSPYSVTLSEVLMVGTVINADIEAIDKDQAGPFSTVQYFIMPGPNSDHFTFQSSLRGELLLKRPLDYETEPLFNITIMAQDQGLAPQNTTTVLTVKVLDADDQNPVFQSERYNAVLPEIPAKGSVLEVKPESLLAEDKDEGIKSPIMYSLAGEDDSQWFNINPASGVITLADDLPDQFLIQPTILLIKAIQEDNPDRQGVTTLTVSRSEHFSTQVQFLQRKYITAVPESLPLDSVIMTTRINNNINEKTMFSLEDNGMGVFHITPSGKIILKSHLDYEDSQEYNIQIYVTDGKSNDTALLKVDILNVNDWDPQFENKTYEFYVESADLRPGDFVGRIGVTDDDSDDHVSLSVLGDESRMFSINDIGELMIQDVSDLNSSEVSLIVIARDSLSPSRTSSVPVTIQFPESMVQSLPLGQGSSWLLMLVFGSVLVVFIIVIICLVIYIHKNRKKERDEKSIANSMINYSGTLPLDPIPPLHQALKGLIPMATATIKARSPIPVQTPVPPSLNNQETNNNLTIGSIRSHNGSEISAEQIIRTGKVQHRNGMVPAATAFPNNHRPTYRDSISLNGSLNGSAKSYATTITVNSCRLPSTLHYARTPLPFFNKNAPEYDQTTSFRDPTMGEARAIGGLPMGKVNPVMNTNNPDRLSGSTGSTNSNSSTPTLELRADTPLDYDEVWPKGYSVPRRVKKLSWEDERNSQVELDPDESVEPISSSSSSNELTVYF